MRKGLHFGKTREGFAFLVSQAVTGGSAQQASAKGSSFWPCFGKGSVTGKVWVSGPRQGFWHSRGSSKGFAVLGTPSPNIQEGSDFWRIFAKGSHFWAHAGRNLEGFGLWARIRKGFTLLGNFAKGLHFWVRRYNLFEWVRTFGHLFEGFAPFSIYRAGREGFAVFGHKWHQA